MIMEMRMILKMIKEMTITTTTTTYTSIKFFKGLSAYREEKPFLR